MRRLPVILAATALSAGLLSVGSAATAAPAQPCGIFPICVFSGTGYTGNASYKTFVPSPGECIDNGWTFRSVFNNSPQTIIVRPSSNCTGGASFDIAPHSGTNLGWDGLSIGGYP